MSARYNRLHDALALRADRIVASSQHYASQYRSRFGPLVKAIPWGVDVRSAPPSRLKSPADPLNVLFVGQMRPYKGVAAHHPARPGGAGHAARSAARAARMG